MTARDEEAGREEKARSLEGGRLSTVVREGGTVRRPAGPWTPAVHALLHHLAARGFDAAPRAHGLDAEGREILDYVEGDAAGAALPWPPWCWSDETLEAVGALLRRYHEAAADFRPPDGARFRLATRALAPGEVVCHNDVAPTNLVRRPDGRLVLIDWDVAGPGDPLDDLAFAARSFAPLHPDAWCIERGFRALHDRPARLRALVDAYGLERRAGFVERVEARARASIARITAAAERGEEAFVRLIDAGGLEPVRESLAWIDAHREALESALA